MRRTLNKSGNYNVIVDLFGYINSENAINPEYGDENFYSHYVCVFGYDPDDTTFFVQDSNHNHEMHTFRINYRKIARACKQRGIVW